MNQLKSRSGKFLNDMLVYGVGTLGSKLITFLLVPLYTFFVPVAEYGYYDLCLTVILVALSVVCLQMNDGGFRFLVETTDNSLRTKIISTIYKVVMCNSAVVLGIALIVSMLTEIACVWLIVTMLVVMAFYEIAISTYRGLGYTKYYALAGIISSAVLFIFSLVLVVWLKMGIEGIFLSNIFARVISIACIELKLKVINRYFSFGVTDIKAGRQILLYSLPLMINGLCWWVISSSNKFFIEYYIGLEENGQYAVVLKFATILQIISVIFYQAWQENALQQYNSPDRNNFFSSIFNNYIYAMSALVVVFCFVLKICYQWIVNCDYQQSVVYLYPLAFSSMVYAVSTFFDLGYQCSRRTARSMPSIMLAGVVSVLGNVVLIRYFGTFGIVASSILSYSVLLVYRAIDTRKYFKISISLKSWIAFMLVVVNGVLFYTIDSIILQAGYLVIVIAVVLLFMPEVLRQKILSRILGGKRA